MRFIFASTLLVLSALSAAQTYDAFTDYSTTNNPNGVWSYGADTGSGFVLSPAYTTAPGGAIGWRNPSISDYIGTYLAATALIQHPGNGANERSVLRFTAPAAATYLVTVGYGSFDAATTDWSVALNGSSLANSFINGTGSTGLYVTTLTLAQNDTLDSLIGYGQNGNDARDSTLVNFTVQTVPEPASLAALGLGALGLLRRRRGLG